MVGDLNGWVGDRARRDIGVFGVSGEYENERRLVENCVVHTCFK